jgi:ATP adenylyltransferase/5',5'''-P-1,P-4-tetraphosphate phosphorylase II
MAALLVKFAAALLKRKRKEKRKKKKEKHALNSILDLNEKKGQKFWGKSHALLFNSFGSRKFTSHAFISIQFGGEILKQTYNRN